MIYGCNMDWEKLILQVCNTTMSVNMVEDGIFTDMIFIYNLICVYFRMMNILIRVNAMMAFRRIRGEKKEKEMQEEEEK